jgi:hypothetical protein
MLKLFLMFLFISGCSSHPTPYQKEKKREGFSDAGVDDIRIAIFRANSHTKPSKAQKYAEFRAIEYCRETEHKHANIMDVSDKTVLKKVTKTSGGSWGPTYAFGMYPYYSRYSSFGLGIGYNSLESESWSETLSLPVIEVFYRCSDQMIRPELILKEISDEQMKFLVKDLKGGLQVEEMTKGSPNLALIEKGDIILKANGQRIEKVYDLIKLFEALDSVVEIQLLREGERKRITLKGKDVTQDALSAEEAIIKYVCRDKQKKYQKDLKKRKLCT